MALTMTVTKLEPVVLGNEDYTIRLQVTLADDAVQVRQQEFATTVNKTDALGDPAKVVRKILDMVDPWVASYKQAKAALNHATYEAIRAGVQSGAVL